MKRRALRTLTAWSSFTRIFSPLLRKRAMIFMLHRFRDRERGFRGQDPQSLRRTLEYLRRQRYEFVPLRDLFGRLRGHGRPLRRAVTFTIDDGYYDQAAVAAPIFAEYDCPVTTFVTTGFLDGHLWFWWDRIEFIFRHTRRRQLSITLDGNALTYELGSSPERQEAKQHFTASCKEVPDSAKHEAIIALSHVAEVDLPEQPPPEYAPMSWDEVRSCERSGMTFGPHTVTHPILSHTPDAQSREELTQSWARLSAKAAKPCPVFCYPNGRFQDFGRREINLLRDLNFLGGVTGIPGYAQLPGPRPEDDGDVPFTLPRFALPEDQARLIQCVSGMERAKEILRGHQ